MREVLARLASGMKVTFLEGLSLFRLAPIIPLLVMIPEFVQHVFEIRSGMFASEEAFNAMAMSDTRWAFDYTKIAGLVIAVFAAARFVGGAGKRWWDLRTIAWKHLLLALVANAILSAAYWAIEQASGGQLPSAIDLAIQLATLPLIIYFIGPFLGDATMTLKRAFTIGWVAAALLVLFVAVAYMPAQLLHQYNHTLAMGQSTALVWGLMIWDTLLVGIMACCIGAAIAAAYWLGRPPVTDEVPATA